MDKTILIIIGAVVVAGGVAYGIMNSGSKEKDNELTSTIMKAAPGSETKGLFGPGVGVQEGGKSRRKCNKNSKNKSTKRRKNKM